MVHDRAAAAGQASGGSARYAEWAGAGSAGGTLHGDDGHTRGPPPETSAILGRAHGQHPVHAETWRDYLRLRAVRSLGSAGLLLPEDGPERLASELAAALLWTEDAAFVHLDAFAGNVLAVGTGVTAVIDIGVTSAAGDRRLDPLSAAVYLAAPQITPSGTPRHRRGGELVAGCRARAVVAGGRGTGWRPTGRSRCRIGSSTRGAGRCSAADCRPAENAPRRPNGGVQSKRVGPSLILVPARE